MRAQEATPLLLALGSRQQQEDVEQQQQQQQEQQTSRRSRSNNNAAACGTTVSAPTPPRAARRRSQSPRLAVIHEVGPVHERNSSSSFSFSTPDVYENYNTLSTQVVWPPANVSWPPGGGGGDQQYSPSLSSSSSSSSLPDDDVEEGDNNADGVSTYQRPSYRTSRKLRNIQFLVICTMMVSIPFVAFVSIMHQQQSFDSPLNNNDGDSENKGGTSSRGGQGDNFIPYESYTSRHHRHFHRIVEKSHLTNVNRTDSTANAAFDISTIPKNILFGDLASLMVPFYFQNSVDLCISTIVPNDSSSSTSDGDYSPTSILPGEVFELRKTILKTRDLFDIFSPVYPRKLRLLGRQKTGEEQEEDNMPGGERKMMKKRRGKHQRNDKEETLHKTKKNHHTVVDVWKILRRFLDDGYMLLGDFQDLNHAKISYTPKRLHQYQLQVWNWKEEFVAFVAQNHEGIMDYLSHACPSKMEKQEQELSLANIKSSSSQSQRKGKEERKQTPSRSCSYTHSKSSHLFWGQTPSSQRPDGNADEASMVLSRLCSTQLSRALVYLNQVLAVDLVVDDKAVNQEVHEIYHNLRKEIRSFLDIDDLFEQQLLMADSKIEQYKEGVSLLKKTKKLLGDLNDEVVAYSKYVEWNEYPEEQEKLKSYISVDWSEFQGWAQEVDLGGKLQSLADDMAHPRSLYSTTQNLYDLDSFLVEQKQSPSRDLVIGNDAADADSIVSAICLAFIERKTPIVPISRETFVYERPEVESLLELAGISNASTKLLYIEDLIDILQNSDSTEDDVRRRLTLVDHNTINDSLHKFRNMFDVVEIVDHHIDEKRYTETCSGKQRTIAFESGKALVASTTTLVAEELLLDQTDTPLPSIATLLLGVILLDSVNLDESIGKVTYRDRDAVSHLLTETDWSKSALLAYLIPSDEGRLTIDTNELFSHLQHAKYEPEFWQAFSVERGLGYDYKAFALGENEEQQSFGISTILMPGLSFLEKEDFILKTVEFMRSKEISFLGIMFAYYDLTAGFQRQLAFCSYEDQRLVATRLYEELDLKEVDIDTLELRSNEIQVHLYDQGNIVPSRKQIGPLLIDYFSSRVDV